MMITERIDIMEEIKKFNDLPKYIQNRLHKELYRLIKDETIIIGDSKYSMVYNEREGMFYIRVIYK